MPVLYHFSPLFHLPPILEEGLRLGEIAHPDPAVVVQAVSLTTQACPDGLACWGTRLPPANKVAVRYACHIDDEDRNLEPARDAWRRLGLPPTYLKRTLDQHGQAKWWTFYHGVIPPDRFVVELRGRAGYVRPSAASLKQIAVIVTAERARYQAVPHPVYPTSVRFVLADESYQDEWLAMERYPADRFADLLAATTTDIAA